MAQIKISALTTGSPKGTDLTPATDTTDTTQAASGTTKKYVRSDELNFYLHAQGLTTYSAVLAATTVALTVVYANGALGVGATLTNAGAQAALTLDGVTLVVGSRVLVKNQVSTFENGIYTVTTVGTGATNWVLTRATDYDQAAEIVENGVVLVDQGTVSAGLLYQETGPGPFTIGTTAITFAAYSTAALPAAGISAVLVSSVVADAVWSGTLTNGQTILGSTGATPVAATITGSGGIAITTGAGTLNIAGTGGGGYVWTEVTGVSQSMSVDNGYISSNVALVTLTLPAIAVVGDTVIIQGKGAGGWLIAQNAGQTIHFGSSTTTPGVGGSLASTNQWDSLELLCVTANTTWAVLTGAQGIITVV